MDNTPAYITDLGIAVAGSVDSGKSTFVGVLTTGKLDDGDGSARMSIAKHPHEIETKKTSSIASKTLVTNNNRAVTLFDLCGHEKYFKTTAYGVSAHFPDYAFLIVGANKGILPMTKQHFTILLSMNIPIIIIVTRYDITPQDIYAETMKNINSYCKNIGKVSAEFINSPYNDKHNLGTYKTDKLNYFKNIYSNDKYRQISIPVITVSNKNGYYIDFINDVLSVLQPRNMWNNFDNDTTKQIDERCNNRVIKSFINHVDKSYFKDATNNTEHMFFVDTVYNPPGIGVVITGINRGGTINVGDTMYLGPFFGKEFKEVRVKSMNNYIDQKITSAHDHHRITIAIASVDKDVNKKTVRKGMILIKNKKLVDKYLTWRFDAIVSVFSHSATLKDGYTPYLQIGNARQSARMILNKDLNDGRDTIKTKEYAVVTFKFKQKPEFIENFQAFVYRSGTVHGVGVVVNVLGIPNDTDAEQDPLKLKFRQSTSIVVNNKKKKDFKNALRSAEYRKAMSASAT